MKKNLKAKVKAFVVMAIVVITAIAIASSTSLGCYLIGSGRG